MQFNKKKARFTSIFILLSIALFVVYQNFTLSSPQCDSIKMQEILAGPTSSKPSVEVNCSIQLNPTDVIKKQIVFHGAESSNIVFDCNGAKIEGNAFANFEVINVQSRLLSVDSNDMTTWSRPQNIEIKNCILQGSTRIIGMARTGNGLYLRASSRKDSLHMARAQLAAPKNITFDNLKISLKTTNTPIYIGPGATQVTVKNSLFSGGETSSVSIYLDAESAKNQILNNVFEMPSQEREIIAVDGSANNIIAGNTFKHVNFGGIYIYRNCGEGGVIRHQKPTGNVIRNNKFNHQSADSISVGSRKGHKVFCSHDQGFAFGSSVSDLDYADNTIIQNNKFFMNYEGKNFFSRFVITTSAENTHLTENEVFVNTKRNYEFVNRVHGSFDDGGGNVIRAAKVVK